MKNIDKNQNTANKLNHMNGLSEKAKLVIAETSFQILDDLFGSLDTAEEINAFVEENYPDEED